MKVRVAGWASVFLCLTWTAACDSPDPVVLGVSLRGELVDGARLAVEDELNLGSATDVDTVMTPEPGSSTVPAVRSAARLAQREGMVAVVAHSNSAASLAAAQIYNDNEIVQLAPTSTAIIYSEAGPYSFRMVPPDDRQGRFLADVIMETFPEGTRVGVFSVNDEYGRSLRSAVFDNLDRAAYPVVVDLPHPPHVPGVREVDFTHAAEAAVAASPALILWLARGDGLTPFLESVGDGLRGVPVVGGDAVSSFDPVAGSRDGARPVQYAEFFDLEGSQGLSDFRRRYRERYGRDARGPEALAYDAMRLLLSGIRAGARSGEEMRSYLISLGRTRAPFQGITGPVTFDAEGDVERTYVVETIGPGRLP